MSLSAISVVTTDIRIPVYGLCCTLLMSLFTSFIVRLPHSPGTYMPKLTTGVVARKELRCYAPVRILAQMLRRSQ